jgi:hypothetical protein
MDWLSQIVRDDAGARSARPCAALTALRGASIRDQARRTRPGTTWSSVARPCWRIRLAASGCGLRTGDILLLPGNPRHVMHDASGGRTKRARNHQHLNLVISENAGSGERLDQLCGHFAIAPRTIGWRHSASTAVRLLGGHVLSRQSPPGLTGQRPASCRYPYRWPQAQDVSAT